MTLHENITKLNTLVKQIHLAWSTDEKVTSLLSDNITEAFERVVPI